MGKGKGRLEKNTKVINFSFFFIINHQSLKKNASLHKVVSLLTNESSELLIASAAIMYGFHLPGCEQTDMMPKSRLCFWYTGDPSVHTAWHTLTAHACRQERCCSSTERLLFARGLKGDLLFHSVGNALFVGKSKLMTVKRRSIWWKKNPVDPSRIEFDHRAGYQQLQKW